MNALYEELHGMVQLSSRHGGETDLKLEQSRTNCDNVTVAASRDFGPSVHTAREFAEVYLLPVVRAVYTAEEFMRLSRRDHRVEEANLWSLVLEFLLDAEQSGKYNPDAIGIAAVQPHRRWYISHLSHIQDLLQRFPLLRRMNVVLRWLEQTYRESSGGRLKLLASRSLEEALLLRQIILSHLRGGELYRAIDLAITARDCTYSCVLSAAQMQTVLEPWFNLTPLVPLFGEYGNGEVEKEWVGNDRRLDNLSQLYEDSVTLSTSDERRTNLEGLDAVIAAVLCGNLEVMEPAFMAAGSWKDILWCHLRSALVVCFTKTLMSAHHVVQTPYASFVEKNTGSQDCWQDDTANVVVKRLAERLQSTYLSSASLEEQLQMRVILQFLSSSGVDWLSITDDLYYGVQGGDGSRLVSHLLLCLNMAYNETLHPYSVQVYSKSLSVALAHYAESLAQLPQYPAQEAMRAVIAMNLSLRDVRQRASVYAAFLMARRRRELETLSRQEVESNEAKLVQLFCKADPVSAVHDEVMRLLNQKTGPESLLTHNPVAESVMWRAMHADSQGDFSAVAHDALEACAAFWLAEPRAELDAIADVAGILRRIILPSLQDPQTALGDMGLVEAHFWMTFSQIRSMADDHARTTAQLDVARSGRDRTLVFQLSQDEAALMRELQELTVKAVSHAGALVRRSPACATAVTWIVQLLAEEATLSVRVSSAGSGAAHERVRGVFALVEMMDALGYIDPDLLPRRSAVDLLDAVRTVRVACGEKLHDAAVEDAKKAAAARRLVHVD